MGDKMLIFIILGALLAGFIPESFAANANLFVSAENAQFENYISGPQVIEVVVIDPDINDTFEAKGEPDVTVNGKILRMVQGVDGVWYGYFADRRMAQIADSTAVPNSREGLDFGKFCSASSASAVLMGPGIFVPDFSDTNGVAIPMTGTGGAEGSPSGAVITQNCSLGTAKAIIPTTTHPRLNVVREGRNINTENPGNEDGQININKDFWPFVQLYTLNPTGNVVIQYNKGGGAQTITLTFDKVDQFANLEPSKIVYSNKAEVHFFLTDSWLNIDPTDEDSWTFGTTGTGSYASATTHYQVFDENGGSVGDTSTNANSSILTSKLESLMCEDNCRLVTNADVQHEGAVFTLQDNNDSRIRSDLGVNADPQDPMAWETEANNIVGNVPITVTEQGPNSGVFGPFDESDNSNIIITTNAVVGDSATFDYNEIPVTIFVGYSSGHIDIIPLDDEWNSGEEIPVRLFDPDANKNSRADEDLDLYNPKVFSIPSITIGDPFTLSENNEQQGAVLNAYYGITKTRNDHSSFEPSLPATMKVDQFSKRGIITSSSTTVSNSIIIDLKSTSGDLQQSINDPNSNFRGFNFYNQDLRSLTSGLVDASILFSNTDPFSDTIGPNKGSQTNSILIGNNLKSQSLTRLSESAENSLNSLPPDKNLALLLEFPTNEVGNEEPITSDFFSFGIFNDGLSSSERVANQIVRLEVEETGDNTNIFEASLEYLLVNQNNILEPHTYNSLNPIGDDPLIILLEGLTGMNSPTVNYLDQTNNGNQRITDKQDSPTHSGIIFLDNDEYERGDTVEFKLIDKDLSFNSELIDIYTSVDPSMYPTDPARDSMGESNLGTFQFAPFGAFGRILDIQFDGERWTSGLFENGGNCGIAGIPYDGANSAFFYMIETEVDSGIFAGDFQIPETYCQQSTGEIQKVDGKTLSLNYLDFRDDFNKITEFSKSALITSSLTQTTPTIQITSPMNNAVFLVGEHITLEAIALDPIEGNISHLIQWTSNLVDGIIGTGSPIQVDNFERGIHLITSTVTNSEGISNSNSIQIRVAQSWNSVGAPVQPTLDSESKDSGDNQWDTRPTFGPSHEIEQNQIVENGFGFNSNYFTVSDNHHTVFDEQQIDTGTENTFSATVYASKGLKIQEFLFGIPNVGESHLAELGIEVWFDYNGEIIDTKVMQKSDVIDPDSVSVNHEKSKCKPADKELKCDTTKVSMRFLEPLRDNVMAIKAIDFKNRDQRTYLNEGFDISGQSLHPMPSKMIPSSTKNEGLIKVTQTEKYSPIWESEDGRTFVMNDFESFIEINQKFERFHDSGNPYTRLHSEFGKVIEYEQKRATNVFDSNELTSKLHDSFAYIYPELHERITPELKAKMIEQEEIAKKILEDSKVQARW